MGDDTMQYIHTFLNQSYLSEITNAGIHKEEALHVS